MTTKKKIYIYIAQRTDSVEHALIFQYSAHTARNYSLPSLSTQPRREIKKQNPNKQSNRQWDRRTNKNKQTKGRVGALSVLCVWGVRGLRQPRLLLAHIPMQTLGQTVEPVVNQVMTTDGGHRVAGGGDLNTDRERRRERGSERERVCEQSTSLNA